MSTLADDTEMAMANNKVRMIAIILEIYTYNELEKFKLTYIGLNRHDEHV